MKVITASTIALFSFMLTILVSALVVAGLHFPEIYMIYILGSLLFIALWGIFSFIFYIIYTLYILEEKMDSNGTGCKKNGNNP